MKKKNDNKKKNLVQEMLDELGKMDDRELRRAIVKGGIFTHYIDEQNIHEHDAKSEAIPIREIKDWDAKEIVRAFAEARLEVYESNHEEIDALVKKAASSRSKKMKATIERIKDIASHIAWGLVFMTSIEGKHFYLRDKHGETKYKLNKKNQMMLGKQKEYDICYLNTIADEVMDRKFLPRHKD